MIDMETPASVFTHVTDIMPEFCVVWKFPHSCAESIQSVLNNRATDNEIIAMTICCYGTSRQIDLQLQIVANNWRSPPSVSVD
jgi:hypothetical protein